LPGITKSSIQDTKCSQTHFPDLNETLQRSPDSASGLRGYL